MSNRKLAKRRTVLHRDDEQVNLTGIEGFETSLQCLVSRSGLELLEHRSTVSCKERVGVQKILNDDAFVFQFLLDGTDEHSQHAHPSVASRRLARIRLSITKPDPRIQPIPRSHIGV